MSRRGKKKMLIFILVALVVVIATAALIIMYPMLSMKPADTGEVAKTGITAVKNGSNTIYFIKAENNYIVIDAGSNKDELENALEQLSIDPMKVSSVFLTHVDIDHVSGLNLFSNAQIYISEDEVKMLDGSVKRNAISYCSLPDGFDSGRLITLTDEQQIVVDNVTIVCVKSPGHTPGSISFLVNHAYLFTGDALRVHKDKLLVSPFSMDKDVSKKTINHLYERMKNYQYVLTAHYGYYKTEGLQK